MTGAGINKFVVRELNIDLGFSFPFLPLAAHWTSQQCNVIPLEHSSLLKGTTADCKNTRDEDVHGSATTLKPLAWYCTDPLHAAKTPLTCQDIDRGQLRVSHRTWHGEIRIFHSLRSWVCGLCSMESHKHSIGLGFSEFGGRVKVLGSLWCFFFSYSWMVFVVGSALCNEGSVVILQ